MGSISVWHWVIVLIVVMLLFGGKKLGDIGAELGSAIREFKDGVNGTEQKSPASEIAPSQLSDKDKADAKVIN